jgi:DNA-binding transcriptional LysR family regulator
MINHVLLPSAPALHALHPGILLRFYGGLYDGPQDGPGKLLYLRFEMKPGRGEEVIPIGSFGYAAYAPAACEDHTRLPWISFGGSLPYNWLESQGVRPADVLITVGDASAVAVAVGTGIGRGLMPECIGERNPLLRRISGPKPEFFRTLRIVGDWSEVSSVRCQSVIGWMERSFAAIGCAFNGTEGGLPVQPPRTGYPEN